MKGDAIKQGKVLLSKKHFREDQNRIRDAFAPLLAFDG
jgi:hypothetical protein